MCGDKERGRCAQGRKKKMSVRKDMRTVVEVPMSATCELGPTHIRVVELHFAILKNVVEHLKWES